MNNIRQVDLSKEIKITQWMLDEHHSNRWNTWLEDSKKYTEAVYDYSWSRYGGYTKYTSSFTDYLGNTHDAQQYWKDNMGKYAQVGVSYFQSTTITEAQNDRLDFIINLPSHGLYLYNLENIAAK